MVTIVTGYAYITTGTVSTDTITGGTTVKISMPKWETDMLKDVTVIKKPVTAKADDSVLWFIDFKQIQETFTVTGHLLDETGDTKETKRNDLRTIYNTGGTVTLVRGLNGGDRQELTVTIKKCKITEEAKVGTGRFPVIIMCIKGTDKYVLA